jgi:hypothetical protein
MHRSSLVAVVVAAAALLAPASAAAATYGDSVSGVEIGFTSTQGTFTGVATGMLPGHWTAVVQHTPLSPNATITGGTFRLATILNGSATTITGLFTGGTVTRTNAGLYCTNQTYAVNGVLGSVAGSGTGTFVATLTHYRTRILGACVSYSASVRGAVTLTF